LASEHAARIPQFVMFGRNAAERCGRSGSYSAIHNGPFTVDVLLKLNNDELLITDYALDKIADNANWLFSLKHRQMAHALLTHDGRTLVNGLFWLCNDDVSFHDVPHERCGRCLALEDNIPPIVPFGDDANEFLALHHYQRSNVFFSHFRNGIEAGSIRVNRPNVPALLIKQLSHRGHLDPPSDTSPGKILKAICQISIVAAS
jgi:hypothetical protein